MIKRAKQEESKYKNNLQKLVVFSFFCLMFGYLLTSCTNQIQEKQKTESPFQPLPESLTATDPMDDVDFSKFKHDGERHQNVPCLFCHQRNEDSPKPKFASHTTCVGCHTPQFKDKTHPICVICHTGQDTEKLKPFPAMTTFKVNFNHAAHFKETSCATCHKTEGNGMTVPSGGNAHETCFQCHTSDKMVGEKNIGSCSTCHVPGTPNRIDISMPKLGVNFDHSKHGAVNCSDCHSPAGGGNQMSAITVSMHSNAPNSCTTCHNEKRAFGANDFSDCRKCHQQIADVKSFGIKFNHSDHAKKDCATCHKSGGAGINFSVPNGTTAHKTCFQCHSPTKDNGSFTSSKCFMCHQPSNTNNIPPPPAVINGNFSHTKHNFFECNNCHTTKGGKMDVPSVVMHKATKSALNCATCHNNQVAFGEDFSSCKKCHTGSKFKFGK
jgi:c(7)-type cytochrome triheme protein